MKKFGWFIKIIPLTWLQGQNQNYSILRMNDRGSIIYKNFKIKHRYLQSTIPEKIIQMREK